MIVFILSNYDFGVLIYISIYLSVTKQSFVLFEVGSSSVAHNSLELMVFLPCFRVIGLKAWTALPPLLGFSIWKRPKCAAVVLLSWNMGADLCFHLSRGTAAITVPPTAWAGAGGAGEVDTCLLLIIQQAKHGRQISWVLSLASLPESCLFPDKHCYSFCIYKTARVAYLVTGERLWRSVWYMIEFFDTCSSIPYCGIIPNRYLRFSMMYSSLDSWPRDYRLKLGSFRS